KQLWERAEAMIRWIESENSPHKTNVLCDVASALVKARRWEQAEALALSTTDNDELRHHSKADALSQLGIVLAQAREWEWAKRIYGEVEASIRVVKDGYKESLALDSLAMALAEQQQVEQTMAVMSAVHDSSL